MGAFRKVTVTLKLQPDYSHVPQIKEWVRQEIEDKILCLNWGERIVSIEVEPHPEDDFGEEE